ncbi:MAG: hypothetical protein H7A23_16295 [Leptospiraceae bacterium]|nr:hypothetical protein [Leptospiraceae bacterium]MCP5496108.1 hypothetical protein [Leptospiraceae bacterium]
MSEKIILNNESVYYPLALGNKWEYKQKDDTTYTNTITGIDPQNECLFNALNSITNQPSQIRKEGDLYFADHFEKGNFQVFIKDNLKKGEQWEVKFKANNYENILVIQVKEVGISKTVENKDYTNVAMIEAESKLIMNGNLMSLNYFTQYYYSKGIGLVLTTSSAGDYHGLISYTIK